MEDSIAVLVPLSPSLTASCPPELPKRASAWIDVRILFSPAVLQPWRMSRKKRRRGRPPGPVMWIKEVIWETEPDPDAEEYLL
jgi:hypothetical protein